MNPMNIIKLILQNLRAGTVSYELPHRHQCTSDHYRGLIHNDSTRCVGCGACAYVCPTGAIEVKRAGNTYTWAYDPGKCTFCERCLERCRPNTLTMESKLPPLYSHLGELNVLYEMEKKKPAPRPAPAVAANTAAAPKAEAAPEAASATAAATAPAAVEPVPNPA